jgi:hypothetical protein
MAFPLAEAFMFATMLVTNPKGETGSGFLISRHTSPDSGRVFLVTNKHVVFSSSRNLAPPFDITIQFNIGRTLASLESKKAYVEIAIPDGKQLWRIHPDSNVDVAVIDVTDLFGKVPKVISSWISYDCLADSLSLDSLDITVGDDIIAIGYPSIRPKRIPVLPLMTRGIIASQIGIPYEDIVPEDSIHVKRRHLRGFVFDGTAIPGSSGSPIILKPALERYIKDHWVFKTQQLPLVLGIVAETRFASLQQDTSKVTSFAGLGFAYDATTIRETIDLFFKSTR